jgi:amidase
MNRKSFLVHTGSLFSGFAVIQPIWGTANPLFADFVALPQIREATIDQLQEYMRTGKCTALQLTQYYLDRIAAFDKKGPTVNSVIEINPDALLLAKASDEDRKKGNIRGALHGIPILIKDNIDTGDKMHTTAGALALQDNRASSDAFLVRQLRAAGAVILGKTNLSEWANFRSTRSVSGWSSRGGQTRNPYSLERNPCGSSAGSAAAVSSNFCAVAVGTETNGSINCPASVNGVVGIKPTVGLVSRSGIIPISSTQDTAGPLTRTVRDAAILLTAMTGVDPNDPSTQIESKAAVDFTQYLKANALAGKRIGVEKNFLTGGHERVLALYKNAIELLRQQGAIVVEVEFLNAFNRLGIQASKVLQYEFKDGVNKYLASANSVVKSLEGVIRFNSEHKATAMPYFQQELLEASQAKGGLEEKDYLEAVSKYAQAKKFYADYFAGQQLDAICGPSNGAAWCTDLVNGDRFSGYGMYGPAAITGSPSINVPMGFVHGLPIGLAFMGKAYQEGDLIGIAYAYEQSSGHRREPLFLSSAAK